MYSFYSENRFFVFKCKFIVYCVFWWKKGVVYCVLILILRNYKGMGFVKEENKLGLRRDFFLFKLFKVERIIKVL